MVGPTKLYVAQVHSYVCTYIHYFPGLLVMCVCVCVCVCVCMCVYVYVCVCVCVYVYTYAYMYVCNSYRLLTEHRLLS